VEEREGRGRKGMERRREKEIWTEKSNEVESRRGRRG
jgi:hypothetical protein